MNEIVSIPYAELSAEQKLRLFWHDFCQCDWWHDDFEKEMEKAGFIKFVRATKRDVEATAFAEELGIIAGQMIWTLTKKGHDILNADRSPQAHAGLGSSVLGPPEIIGDRQS
jgi:hypothetical protein